MLFYLDTLQLKKYFPDTWDKELTPALQKVKDGGQMCCMLCKKKDLDLMQCLVKADSQGSTTNMNKHLKREHKEELKQLKDQQKEEAVSELVLFLSSVLYHCALTTYGWYRDQTSLLLEAVVARRPLRKRSQRLPRLLPPTKSARRRRMGWTGCC